MYELIAITVWVLISGATASSDCYVKYETVENYRRASMIKNGFIIETIAGGLTPEGMTCDTWKETIQREIYDKYPVKLEVKP